MAPVSYRGNRTQNLAFCRQNAKIVGRMWPETAVNSRRRSDTARKELVFEVEWLFWGMQVSVGGLEGT